MSLLANAIWWPALGALAAVLFWNVLVPAWEWWRAWRRAARSAWRHQCGPHCRFHD